MGDRGPHLAPEVLAQEIGASDLEYLKTFLRSLAEEVKARDPQLFNAGSFTGIASNWVGKAQKVLVQKLSREEPDSEICQV